MGLCLSSGIFRKGAAGVMLLFLRVHVFVMCLCLLCGGASIPREGDEGKESQTNNMCLIEGTCIVLKEGNGTVPSEIEVSLSLVYNGDVDYGVLRYLNWQNIPIPVLDSLNMTFIVPSDARRNVASIVTSLEIQLEDFEEIGSFLSEGFPELTELVITVFETTKRTRIRSDMLKGLLKLRKLVFLFQSSEELYTSSLNTIPNLFSPFRCTNDSSSSYDLHHIGTGLPYGNISLWRLDDICTKSPMFLNLQAAVPPLPALSGSLRPLLQTPPLFMWIKTLPYPPGMTTQEGAFPSYWDMLCDSMEGITDVTLAPFYVSPGVHHGQSQTDLTASKVLLDTDVNADSSEISPSLYRERCPLALDLSSLNLYSLVVKGFSLGSPDVTYFNTTQPQFISFQNCTLTYPLLFNSLKYIKWFRGIHILSVHVDPQLAPVQLSMPSMCWEGECERIQIENSPGFAIDFYNSTPDDRNALALDDNLQSLNLTLVPHLQNLTLDDVKKGGDFWSYLATRGEFVNSSLSITQPYFTIDQLHAIFPCVYKYARFGESEAERCCQNVEQVIHSYFKVRLKALDIEQSYKHISSPILVNRYWRCGLKELVMDGIPLLTFANDIRNSSTTTDRLELQSSELAVLEEFSFNQTKNVLIHGSTIRSVTEPLSATGFQSFEVSNGRVSKFDMSSIGASKLPFLDDGTFNGLTNLNMSNNRIDVLGLEQVYKYFQCFFPSAVTKIDRNYGCYINFNMNNLTKVQITNDIPPENDRTHRNISKQYKDWANFKAFEIIYSRFANIKIDISSNNLKTFTRASVESIRGLRTLNVAKNGMEILEGGFISGRSCIGTGCYVDLSFNRLGKNISALEEAFRVQSRNYSDAVVHTLNLSHNNLHSFPKYSTAIAGSLSGIMVQISRPDAPMVKAPFRPPYFTLNLRHNNIKFVNESLCFGVDQSKDVTIYVDLSYNNISFVSDEAFKCGSAKLMVNLNYNPHLTVLPTFWYGEASSLMLLSVKGTSIRHIPKSYRRHDRVLNLKSFNLEWSYKWSCCDLAYVDDLDTSSSSSLLALDPNEIAEGDNLLLHLMNERRIATDANGISFTSKECLYQTKKYRYFEFSKTFPDINVVCSVGAGVQPETETCYCILIIWLTVLMLTYYGTVLCGIYFELLNQEKAMGYSFDVIYSLAYLFKATAETTRETEAVPYYSNLDNESDKDNRRRCPQSYITPNMGIGNEYGTSFCEDKEGKYLRVPRNKNSTAGSYLSFA
eukprot:Nk52_evm18s2309 gene=Nk52_evmTU18s2309